MYVCHDCELANPVKLGKCPNCWAFGTFIKDPTKVKKSKSASVRQGTWGDALVAGTSSGSTWYQLQHPEMERIFSSGVKKWGLYLLGGEPGIGKSTIMLQILEQLAQHNNLKIAYFSWEEDTSQITDRKNRLNWTQPPVKGVDAGKAASGGSAPQHTFDIYQANHLEDILTTTQAQQYDLIVVDSIQTVYTPHHESVAWSISQIKRCSEKISEWCKKHGVACFLIGHVTKWWEIAGPKYLEHIVDVVLYLEGDRYGQYRFLRTKKNRFWPSDEVGIFEMTLFGLQPVYDLKERIINQANITTPGNVLTVGIDNGRPVLVCLEVLLNKANGKYPQRIVSWIEQKRLQLIIAILERYLKINLWAFDIYVNIPGEFEFRDTGLDLGIAAALYSQSKNVVIDKNLVFVWELWLSGQILPSKNHSKRTKDIQEFTCIDHDRLKYISELPGVF